jgi:hypothetical protein
MFIAYKRKFLILATESRLRELRKKLEYSEYNDSQRTERYVNSQKNRGIVVDLIIWLCGVDGKK